MNGFSDDDKELKEKCEMQRRATFYFRDGEYLPYCGICWETKNQAVQVFPSLDNREGSAEWVCPSCKHLYPRARVRGTS
jgi:hypothetical protein